MDLCLQRPGLILWEDFYILGRGQIVINFGYSFPDEVNQHRSWPSN